MQPYIDPTTDEWVGEYETKDREGEVTRTTEWFATEVEAHRYTLTGNR